MKPRTFIGSIGTLLALVGVCLIIAHTMHAGADCIRGLAYDVCTGGPNLWLPGLITAAAGVIAVIGAIFVETK
jgi:hypothetical protein